jgi:hypothetical protein
MTWMRRATRPSAWPSRANPWSAWTTSSSAAPASTTATAAGSDQGCQIFLGSTYQNGKNIPDDNKIKCLKMPNGHKIYKHFPPRSSNMYIPKTGFLYKRAMHIKSITHNRIPLFSLKTSCPGGIRTWVSVPVADAMSTLPGHLSCLSWNVTGLQMYPYLQIFSHSQCLWLRQLGNRETSGPGKLLVSSVASAFEFNILQIYCNL